MKKLRKILVALAVLALLISSVAVLVVTAEDAMEYTGSLERAQELLADVPSMDRTDSTTDLRKEAIKKVVPTFHEPDEINDNAEQSEEVKLAMSVK